MLPQIISASRRTDIPAFYSEWFINRIREGFCLTFNPFNPQQVSRVSLKPEDVICFAFWTRFPEPLVKYLNELDDLGFAYYFMITILGYPKDIDPRVPALDRQLKSFIDLSSRIGRSKVVWRYDPILLSSITSEQWHVDQFEKIAAALKVYTKRVLISIIDPYVKTQKRMTDDKSKGLFFNGTLFNSGAYKKLIGKLSAISRKYNIELYSCAEDLSEAGVKAGACIDRELIVDITGKKIAEHKDKNQRKLCNCLQSKDIGANNTCLFGCKYCYATKSYSEAIRNHSFNHSPQSPLILDLPKGRTEKLI